jgi:hypothetical protein
LPLIWELNIAPDLGSRNHTKNPGQLFMGRRVATVLLFSFFLAGSPVSGYCQRYLADYDSTLFIRDTVRPLVKRLENLLFTGYIQPEFQVAQSKGAPSYEGGNFPEYVDNRFLLRRARIRVDYRMPGKAGSFPAALFTFQIEATERDVNVRDMFVRVFEPNKNNFSLTAGLFSRPFGFEVNLSSSYRETPERGRMSQILMPSERDLGAMITYESQRSERRNPLIKWDLGVFNGQGKSGPAEFDSYKDLISRFALKPLPVFKQWSLSGGLSILRGGWVQATRYRYEMGQKGNDKIFVVDSSLGNIGSKAPRHYYGADLQIACKHGWGKTEIRGEYWRGKQPGTSTTTVNPGVLPLSPTYIRNFDGGFFYFLQNIGNKSWEVMAKLDWYDPNTKVSGMEIGKNGTNLTAADIRFTTVGFGMTKYFNDNLKLLLYYAVVRNEKAQLVDYTDDFKDNVLTCRMQIRF